jgi:integrating conjugative element protein (TIGR03758 family)
MNSTQQTAFQLASGASATTLLIAIAAIVLTLTMVWGLWVTFGTFRAWQDGSSSLFDLAWNALRVSIILMVLGFYLR